MLKFQRKTNFREIGSSIFPSCCRLCLNASWTCVNQRLHDFEVTSVDIMTTLSYIWTSVIDSNNMKAPSITPVIWSFPPIGRLKVVTDGAANGSLRLARLWDIFRQVEVSFKVASRLLSALLLPTKRYWWLL